MLTNILIKLFAGNYAIFGFSTIFFFFAPYLTFHGFPSHLSGWVIGAFYASSTTVKPIAGFLIERCGVRRSMIIAGVLGLASGLGLIVVPLVFIPLFMLRLIMGLSFGIFLVALTAYQNIMVPDSERGASFAVTTVGSICPMFTLMPLCDMLITSGNFSIYLLLPAVMGGLCIFLAFSLDTVGEVRGKEKQVWGSYADLMREVPLIMLAITVLFFAFADAAIIYISSLTFHQGLTPSFFMVAFAGGSIFIRIAGRHYFNRTPRILLMGPSLLCMGIGLFLATMVSNNWFLACAGFIHGLGVGYGFPALLSLGGDLVSVYLRPKITSFILFFMDMSWFMLPLYMGYASSLGGIVMAYRILAAVSIIFAIFIHLVWIRYRIRKR